MSALGPNGLTQLLGAMTQSHPSQHPAAGVAPDLSQLLQSIAPSQQQASSAQVAQPQGQGQAFPNILQNPALASLLGVQATGQPPSAPTQAPASQPAGQPDMNEIMAQLAKYQR